MEIFSKPDLKSFSNSQEYNVSTGEWTNLELSRAGDQIRGDAGDNLDNVRCDRDRPGVAKWGEGMVVVAGKYILFNKKTRLKTIVVLLINAYIYQVVPKVGHYRS